MPANNTPIFALTPNLGVAGVLLTTAMTNTKAFDGTEGTGTAMALIYTAGSNGSQVYEVDFRYGSTAGATASGTTTATLVRLWANNGSANTTATNNILLGEVAIPAQAVTALGTSVLPSFSITNVPVLPAGWKLYAGMTVAIGGTNCALSVSAFGGDY